ncbi:TadE/TadG family type IV pilus assembly protein [Humisphaera borealis]|uniref:Pilus assembly protein n=1 Tax=Humisphaera borealis TaxID=2807512 RepID=A0A7M2WUQ9_9BACT|nr:TadE/TadG family type IV pilus assembly protein [Humisphaera borealis]QOV89267.1 pilus assembly protein [Humisphaera borealis]
MQQIKRNRSARRVRRGNGVLEAALVLPVLLALSMGMVEFGQFFYMKHTIQAASRDGARTAILSSTTHSAAQTAITNTMNSANVASNKYTVTFTNASTSATISDVGSVAKGTGIKVTVSATAGTVSVRPLGVIPANKAIVGVTTMIKE